MKLQIVLLLSLLLIADAHAIVDVQMDWVAAPGTVWYPGDTLLMGYSLHNAGADPCPGFSVRFYASTDTTIAASDHELGVFPGGVLGGGQAFADAPFVTLPLDLPAGTYYVGAVVTAVGDMMTSNNRAYDADSIQIIANSDLRAVVILSPNTPMYPGRSFQVALETRNRGPGDCPGFTVTFVASLDTVMTKQDYIIGIHDYGPLVSGEAGGGSTQVSVRLPSGIPADLSYHVGAIIEYEHDLDLANNTAYDSSAIFVEARPDLNAVSFEIEPGLYQPGEFIDTTATVRNNGSADCTGFELGFYLSSDDTISDSDLLLRSSPGSSMAAGARYIYDTKFRIPEDTPPGEYYFGIIVNCPLDGIPWNDQVASVAFVFGEGPRLVAVRQVHPAFIEIDWTAPPGLTYVLKRSDTLADGFPDLIQGGLSPQPGVNTVLVSISGPDRRFFRIETE